MVVGGSNTLGSPAALGAPDGGTRLVWPQAGQVSVRPAIEPGLSIGPAHLVHVNWIMVFSFR
jgi:hypothetical protein